MSTTFKIFGSARISKKGISISVLTSELNLFNSVMLLFKGGVVCRKLINDSIDLNDALI